MKVNSVFYGFNATVFPPKTQFKKQNCSQNVSKKNSLQADTVSFGAGITGIKISKRRIDYGDIFVEGAKLISENLERAKKACAYMANADLSGSNLQKSSFFLIFD